MDGMEQVEKRKRGRPSDYYTAREVADIFNLGLSTVYKKPEEFHGRQIAGTFRFPRPIIDAMRKRDGIHVSK
jgi:hypothetical protein